MGFLLQPHRGNCCRACPFLPLCLVIAAGPLRPLSWEEFLGKKCSTLPCWQAWLGDTGTGLTPKPSFCLCASPPGKLVGEITLSIRGQPCPGHRCGDTDLRAGLGGTITVT